MLATLTARMAKTCCRSCPRCADCPVLVAAAARRRRGDATIAALVEDVLVRAPARRLPEQVVQTLDALDAVRHAPRRAPVVTAL
jgi:hypothetical protein